MYFKYVYDTLGYTIPFHFKMNAFFIGYRFNFYRVILNFNIIYDH